MNSHNSSPSEQDYSKEQVLGMLGNLETEANDLSEIVRESTDIAIEVTRFHPFDNEMPEFMSQVFAKYSRPARKIDAVSFGLIFEQEARLYKPTYAHIFFDNNLMLALTKPHHMQQYDVFNGEILDDALMPVPPFSSATYSGKDILEIMNGVGVSVPLPNQKASPQDVLGMLELAENWQYSIEKPLAVSPGETIIVREVTQGSLRDTNPDLFNIEPGEIDAETLEVIEAPEVASLTPVWHRALTIVHEQAAANELLPASSLQFMFTSDNPLVKPGFTNAYRVPLVYEDAVFFLDDGISTTKKKVENHPDARIVTPSVDLLKKAREIVLAARVDITALK